MEELESRKDAQKATELASLRAEMQTVIDSVSAERDENLNNYTKVINSNVSKPEKFSVYLHFSKLGTEIAKEVT